jgi:hypothetical protein
MVRARRAIAGLLAKAAVRIDPAPPLTFTTQRYLADMFSGQIGKGIVRRGFNPGDGPDARY